MEQPSTLRFAFEWDRSDAIRTPELRETWARLEIWAGGECTTQVEDVETGSTRRSIYGPLYPLAEWIAYSWWFLRAHVRPASIGSINWTHKSLDRTPRYPHRWLDHHNVRAAGEGFAWPDMTLLPEGSLTRIVWRTDPPVAHYRPVRFIRQGETLVPTDSVELALAELVDLVLTRLAEQGIRDTMLHKEWEAIRQIEPGEAEFCLAAARLGLDPYSEGRELTDTLVRVSETLEGRLFEDFLNAVNPRHIEAGLEWIEQGSRRIEEPPDSGGQIAQLRSALSPAISISTKRPWEVAYTKAREVRDILGLDSDESFNFDGWLALAERPSGDRGLQALGGMSRQDYPVLVLGRSMLEESSRFAQGRAFWRFLAEREEPRFLLTTAYTDRQRVERAFAAELLAPAEGILQHLEFDDGPVGPEDLEAVGKSFGVSSWVIRHQVENQLLWLA